MELEHFLIRKRYNCSIFFPSPFNCSRKVVFSAVNKFHIHLFYLVALNQAGKKLLLITNSDYHYTNKMMQHAFNQFLPDAMDWRALFDMASPQCSCIHGNMYTTIIVSCALSIANNSCISNSK